MATDDRIKSYTNKKGDKLYMFRIYIGIDPMTGKRKQTTRRGFSTEREARIELSRLELEIEENGFNKKAKSKRFIEVYEAWFENYKKTVKESTWASTKIIFNVHILPAFGNLFIDKIDVLFCQKVINAWADNQPRNFKKFKNYTSNVFHYALSIDLIQQNPITKITIPKGEALGITEKDIPFYDKDELLSFIEIAKSEDLKLFTFFYLLAFTGIRKGEAFALTWNDVNTFSRQLTINKTVARGDNNRLFISTTKTKAGNRQLSLDQSTIKVLMDWKKHQDEFKTIVSMDRETELIFSNENNELHSPTITKSWLKRIYNKHPEVKRISAHGFRHTHASLLFEAGAQLKDVQDRLGHADIQITANIYTHVTQKKKETTADLLASFINS